MVSPRKRPATTAPNHHQGADRKHWIEVESHTYIHIQLINECFDITFVGAKVKQVFARKKFFLDIKNLESLPVKLLAKDLILLGGVSYIFTCHMNSESNR